MGSTGNLEWRRLSTAGRLGGLQLGLRPLFPYHQQRQAGIGKEVFQ